MPIEFRDYSIEVSAKMKDAAKRFLIEAAHEVTSQTIRTTSPKKQQLRGSWGNSVDENAMTAQIGSPLEESFWNEFGTGSHAIHGDGRKGWWVYIEGSRGARRTRACTTASRRRRKPSSTSGAKGFLPSPPMARTRI